MDNTKSLIQFTKTAIENVDKIDDIIDKSLENLKDYTETAWDIITPVKSFISVFNLAKKIRVKSFIKNYAQKVNEELILDERTIERLEKYMSNPKNTEFVAEIIDSAINSKSSLCSAILGFYAGLLLSKIIEISYKDMIIVNALRHMNDLDVKYFIKLYEFLNAKANPEDRNFSLSGISELKGFASDVEVCIQKLKGLQIIGYNDLTYLYNGGAPIKGRLTEITDYLFNIICDSKVIKE